MRLSLYGFEKSMQTEQYGFIHSSFLSFSSVGRLFFFYALFAVIIIIIFCSFIAEAREFVSFFFSNKSFLRFCNFNSVARIATASAAAVVFVQFSMSFFLQYTHSHARNQTEFDDAFENALHKTSHNDAIEHMGSLFNCAIVCLAAHERKC